jgi:hypothetical protein
VCQLIKQTKNLKGINKQTDKSILADLSRASTYLAAIAYQVREQGLPLRNIFSKVPDQVGDHGGVR